MQNDDSNRFHNTTEGPEEIEGPEDVENDSMY